MSIGLWFLLKFALKILIEKYLWLGVELFLVLSELVYLIKKNNETYSLLNEFRIVLLGILKSVDFPEIGDNITLFELHILIIACINYSSEMKVCVEITAQLHLWFIT